MKYSSTEGDVIGYSTKKSSMLFLHLVKFSGFLGQASITDSFESGSIRRPK